MHMGFCIHIGTPLSISSPVKFDLTVATFSGFILQICLIMALSICRKRWRSGSLKQFFNMDECVRNRRLPRPIAGCYRLCYIWHTAAIASVNTINERRWKIVWNKSFDCHLSPWQSKTLFLTIFLYRLVVDPCSSIFKSIFDCRLSGVYYGLSVPVTYLFSRTDLFFSLWKLNHSIQTQRISFVFLQFTLHVF